MISWYVISFIKTVVKKTCQNIRSNTVGTGGSRQKEIVIIDLTGGSMYKKHNVQIMAYTKLTLTHKNLTTLTLKVEFATDLKMQSTG